MNRDEWLHAACDFETEGRWSEAMLVRADLAKHDPQPIAVDSVGEAPWNRGDWHGGLISIGDCPTDDFTVDDVDVVLGYGDTGGGSDGWGWDGNSAGIARLKDGRFVAWESNWGPTGSGFSCDAYGGDADIAFARTAGEALAYISELGRELIKWA